MEVSVPRLAIYLLKHLRNAAVDRSGVSSKCKAQDVAQVYRQMYVFFISPAAPPVFTNRGPVKSTPTWVKAAWSVTPVSGRSACLGDLNGIPSNLLQVTHRWRVFFTNRLPLVTQYWLLSSASVSLNPPWLTFLWQFSTISLEIWWSLGSKIGYLVSGLRWALVSRLRHLRTSSSSLYSPSCCVKVACCLICRWISWPHWSLLRTVFPSCLQVGDKIQY